MESSDELRTRPLSGSDHAVSGSDMVSSAGSNRYVALEELGRGGMGVVWRAYDSKLQREVALKTLSAGVLSSGAQDRLVREAQAMARLSHPNVVAVYDVEIAEDVTLAMEIVVGQTLRQWLGERARSPREIMARFLAAGRGLQAAHEAGLLHRDFKPANVLVAASGVTKVTDFGLARVDEVRSVSHVSSLPGEPSASHSAERSMLTEVDTVLGTPRYMAPEQLAGERLTTAADQYALCVSLWEALVGQPPFEVRGTSDAELEQLRQAKLRGPPPWPRRAKGAGPWAAAIRRGLSPLPEDRWPSVEALLEQLRRDPARRRRAAAAVGTLAVLAASIAGWRTHAQSALVAACEAAGGRILALWTPTRAQEITTAFGDEEIAFAQASWERSIPRVDAFAEDWQRLRTEVCFEAKGDAEREHASLVRACLDEQAIELRRLLSAWSAPDAVVARHAAIAAWSLPRPDDCLERVGLAQRGLFELEGEPVRAHEVLREQLAEVAALQGLGRNDEALTLAREVSGGAREAGLIHLAPRALTTVGTIELDLGLFERARDTFLQAFDRAEAADDDVQALIAANGLAHTLGVELIKPVDAQPWLAVAQAKQQRLGLVHEHPLVAQTLLVLGSVLREEARFVEAQQAHQQALDILESLVGPDHPRVADALQKLAEAEREQGHYAEALEAHARALRIREAVLGPDHPLVGLSYNNVGTVHYAQGQLERSLELLERAASIAEGAYGPRHPDAMSAQLNIAVMHHQLGHLDQAIAGYQKVLEVREATLPPDHSDIAMVLSNLGAAHHQQRRYDRALEAYDRALRIFEQALGPDHPSTAATLNNMSITWTDQGRYDEALELLQRVLEIREAKLGPDHPEVATALYNLGSVYEGKGSLEEALGYFGRARALREKVQDPMHPELALVLAAEGRIHLAQGRPSKALAPLERAVTIATTRDVDATTRADARFLLARALGPRGAERERAIGLAREALAETEPGELRQEIEQWLAQTG